MGFYLHSLALPGYPASRQIKLLIFAVFGFPFIQFLISTFNDDSAHLELINFCFSKRLDRSLSNFFLVLCHAKWISKSDGVSNIFVGYF